VPGPELSTSALADAMTAAAGTFLASLSPAQHAQATGRFDGAERTTWTYLPGDRPGVPLGDLDDGQRRLAYTLLSTAFSERGLRDADNVLRVEAIREGLADVGSPSAMAEVLPLLAPGNGLHHWVRVLGEPGTTDPWLWRVSGHHLVAQATVVDGTVAVTPQFFGAQPATVAAGPYAGFRPLAREEDLARRLVLLLDEQQRARAVTSPLAPADILTRYDPVARPERVPAGLARAAMGTDQRELLQELVRQYLDRAAPAAADRAWRDIDDAGLDRVRFSWAGGTAQGIGHYYAVTGPTFLLEYDNTQNDADHIHSVWRDLQRDWAGDVLARHYATGHHRHG